MSDHIVSAFSEELEQLSADLLRMGGIAESMISDACRALITSDLQLAHETVDRDGLVDDMEADIEQRIVRLLALRQPMASDLRAVVAALKVSSDLERIGDLSKNIAKRVDEVSGCDVGGALKGIERMGRAVSAQLNDVLDSYSEANAAMALHVWNSDEDIDQHYNSLFREVITYMMEDPRMIGAGAHLMFIAKNLERVGDHCTNIAEIVHYQVTGDYLASNERPKAPLLGNG
ncbi:MAG: phosphate signaling complex protein PhoU [Alphaproteobacteria bacterium]|jgi:phosphate transport system protein|nr:phosphate signaling complex protein PhoU [Alphaproteobacteria bacterium]